MARGSEVIVHRFADGALTGHQIFSFMTMMFFALSILPAIANVLSVIPMWNYALTDEKYKEILAKLQERRREEGELVE
jgi:Na+/melibiose symporter-like transporter